MKKIYNLILILLIISLSKTSFAQEQTITLRDGTVLKGELTQVVEGVYTIQSSSLGQTQIKADQIASIANASNAGSAPVTNEPNPIVNSGAFNAQMTQLQGSIMANPEMMAEIQQLASDPEVVQLLSNPAILQAATTKDVNALKNNPAAQELMQNPKVKALIEKLRGSGSGQ